MEAKVFFQFEIIINVFFSSFRFIWIPMLCFYGLVYSRRGVDDDYYDKFKLERINQPVQKK